VGPRFLLITGLAVAILAANAGSGHGYTFGQGVTQTAPEQTVFDHSADACREDADIPDLPARAFRDASGMTQLLATHYRARRWVGYDLNGIQHRCPLLLVSKNNPDPSAYDDRQWLGSPYTIDGQNIYVLGDQEYQGWRHSGMCDTTVPGWQPWNCFYSATVFMQSTNGGVTYTRTPAPAGLVASVPYPYEANAGPEGVFQPSNIVYRPDGYFYSLVVVFPFQAQQGGTCLMRTHTLSDPSSWRAWDGSAFTVRFIDPYVEASEPPASHVCVPLSPLGIMSASLTYNTYFGRYLLIDAGNWNDPTSGQPVSGFYYSLSDDLIHWDPLKLLMQATLPSTFTCGGPQPVEYPSLLSPTSPSRNYTDTSQRNYLYFTRFNPYYYTGGCDLALDRDLIRIPIAFSATRGPVSKPDCSRVKASPSVIGTPNGRLVNVRLGDQAGSQIEITGVTQDEPTTDAPDALRGTTPDRVRVRADRRSGSDGRVYRVKFIATGGNDTCWGTATVSVPNGGTAVDSAPPAYDSLSP
jgi:hypothetical protein